MYSIFRLLAIAISVLLAGCGTLNKPFTDRQALNISTGDTPEDVLAVLGPPSMRIIGSQVSEDVGLEEFGPHLMELGIERLESWIYFDEKTAPTMSIYQGIPRSNFKALNVHFVDGLVVRNDRKISKQDILKIKKGMTPQEIAELLGSPLLIYDGWIYNGPTGYIVIPVEFVRGVLTEAPIEE